MKDLTKKQADILAFIKRKIAADGEAPSLSEIGAEVGIRYRAGVSGHLEALVKKGKISREPGVAHGIKVLP